MGFFKFVFAFMFVIPIAVLMWFLLYKLNIDARDAAKKDAEIKAERKAQKTSNNKYSSRTYTTGYKQTSEGRFSYNNPYEPKAFGTAAAEMKRREQERNTAEQDFEERPKVKKPQKPLSKRKRRKQRKNRKKDRDK